MNFRPGHHETTDVWHRGDTHPDNLTAKHRGHHQLKTRGFWSSTQLPNGQVRWRSLAQLVATEAFDHDAADLRPIDLDEATRQAAIGAERAQTLELLTPAQAALQLVAGQARADVGQRAPNKHDEPPF